MRSTKASNAIERLKNRTNNPHYSMTLTSSKLFSLVLRGENGDATKLSDPLPMEEFVAFVNAFRPQTPKRVSKLDIEFSKQLVRKPQFTD